MLCILYSFPIFPAKAQFPAGRELAKPGEFPVSINHASQDCLARIYLCYEETGSLETNLRKHRTEARDQLAVRVSVYVSVWTANGIYTWQRKG